MKRISLLILTLAGCIYFPAIAQNEAEQKAWKDYMTPGDIHKMMAKSAGEWKQEVTLWMQPGAPPTTSNAISKNEMILGGRYLQSTSKGDFMGMPFEGVGLLAYDNAAKKFYNTWVDNMGTGIMSLEGVWNDQTKSIEFKGMTIDPVTGHTVPVREVFKLIDDNHQVMEMYMTANGKEFKSMEIKMSR